MDKVKVMSLIWSMGDGGAQQVLINYLRDFKDDPDIDFRVCVYTEPTKSKYDREIEDKNYNVYYLNNPRTKIQIPYFKRFFQRPISKAAWVNAIQRAWIQKRMLFKRFFISTSFGTIISAVVGISMAYMGAGAWALVGQYLTNSFIDTVVLFITNDWRPKLQFSFDRAKQMLSYGWKVLLTTVVYTVEGDLRSLIVGKQFGSADLAYYDQGKKFPNLLVSNINTSISNVMFPVLSKNQDNRERMKAICRRSIKTSTYLLAPLLLGLIAVSNEFVRVILSDKWLPCVPFLQILTLVYLVRPLTTTDQQAIMSTGRSDLTLRIMIAVNVTDVILLLIAVFAMKSVIMIAVGALLTEVVSMALFMKYVKKCIGYTYLEQLSDIAPSLLLAISMGVIVYLVGKINVNVIIVLFLQVVVGAGYYLAMSCILHFEPFIYLVKMLKEKFGNA